jgi:hypothetical protein
MAPRRSGPLIVCFVKTLFLKLFFSTGGPKFKSRDGADLGSRPGASLAPPPVGRGRSSSREAVPPGEEAGPPGAEERPSSLAGRPPPRAAPSPTLVAPPLSEAPSGRAGAPLAVEGLRSQRKGHPPAPASSAGLRHSLQYNKKLQVRRYYSIFSSHLQEGEPAKIGQKLIQISSIK